MLLIMLRVGIVLLCAVGLMLELSIALPPRDRQRIGARMASRLLRFTSWLRTPAKDDAPQAAEARELT
jgi:hypothetical protein